MKINKKMYKKLYFFPPSWEAKIGVFFDSTTFKTIFCFIIGVTVLHALYNLVDYGFITSEITAYPIRCEKELCTKLKPTTYKVNIDEQYVIDKNTLYKYKGCVVLNRKNWKCDNEIGYNKTGFIDGKYLPPLIEQYYLNEGIRFVSKYKWYTLEKDVYYETLEVKI